MRLNCKRQTPQKPNMSLSCSAKNTPFAVQVLSAFNYKYLAIFKFHLSSNFFSSIIQNILIPSHILQPSPKKNLFKTIYE